MSILANWSHTAKATIWPSLGMGEWGGKTYGPPVVIECDYGSKSKRDSTGSRSTSSGGQELVVNLYVWTEYANAQIGDMLALGAHTALVPPADADEIINIGRDADTFYRTADDYEIATGTA